MQLYVLPLKDIHYQNVVEGFSGMLVSENSSMTLFIFEPENLLRWENGFGRLERIITRTYLKNE